MATGLNFHLSAVGPYGLAAALLTGLLIWWSTRFAPRGDIHRTNDLDRENRRRREIAAKQERRQAAWDATKRGPHDHT